ncbi:MAG: BatD family protein [Acidobacteriota bacterium]
MRGPCLHLRARLAALSLGLALLLSATATPAQEPQIDLQLEPGDVLGLDELAVLSLKISTGERLREEAAPRFELDNLAIAAGPSKSTSLRFIDNSAVRTLTFTWHLQPQGLGRARIHSGALRIGDTEVELPERRIDVVASAPGGRRRHPRDAFRDPFQPDDPFDSPFNPRRRPRVRREVKPPKIYLSAEAVPQNPYVGQQVLYTIYLFTQADVQSVTPEELPDFKGFWSRVIPQPDQLQPQMLTLDGERIGKVVLLQRALFPRRAGRFEIDGASARLSAKIPEGGRFASGIQRAREILRSSRPVELNVRPLPPAPPGFDGAIGQLSLTAELAPTELEVGEAATLTVTLAGQGHVQGLQAPALPPMDGIEVFPPQQQSTESVDRRTIAGERRWSFVLVPERPGRWALPAIEIPFFDPRQERYRTASSPLPSLDVRAATRMARGDGQSLELHSIRTAALPPPGEATGDRLATWLFALPWSLAILLFVGRRRYAGRHEAERHRLFERLKKAAAEPRPRQAAAEIEEAWREFLAARWGLPPGTPSTRWAALLTDLGVRAKAAAELVQLADDLHYLRYAPKLSSTTELRQDLVERSRKLAQAVS